MKTAKAHNAQNTGEVIIIDSLGESFIEFCKSLGLQVHVVRMPEEGSSVRGTKRPRRNAVPKVQKVRRRVAAKTNRKTK